MGSVRDVVLRLAGAERPNRPAACPPSNRTVATGAAGDVPMAATGPSSDQNDASKSGAAIATAAVAGGMIQAEDGFLRGGEQEARATPGCRSGPALQVEEERQPMLHTGPDARFEVLSLVGTLSPQGLHLHASLGDEEGAVCGGHLVRATVHTTAEIVLGEAPAFAFSRAMDPATGFKELVVEVGRDACR